MFTEQLPDLIDYIDNLPELVCLVGHMNIHFDKKRPVATDGCKLSALSSFRINSTQILRLGSVVSMEASNDYTALRI